MATVSISQPFGMFVVSIGHAIRWARGRVRRSLGGFKPERQIHIYTHHKIGTALTSKVFRDIATYYGLTFVDAPGYNSNVKNADVVHYWHSQISDEIQNSNHKGIHIVRDPRDVIVSGYLYHQRCKEEWCTNQDFNIDGDISYPQVDYSQEHLSHDEKVEYLNSLNKKSYQENLKSMSQDDGLIFEMDGFAGRTIADLLNWNSNPNILDVKFEDLLADYDEKWRTIFIHLGFEGKHLERVSNFAKRHDLSRMSTDQIAKDKHISTGKLTKWKEYFNENIDAEYRKRFGDAHTKLDYD